jgi:DnaJ-domain-containing protein 1
MNTLTMQNNLIKRLEIIKNAVAMEEDDLIAMQLQKLKQLELDDAVQHIVELIQSQQYKDVIQLIGQYKNDNSGLTVFEDPQIQGLKLELKVLENRANELSDEKIEYERQINNFNSEYMQRLGELIEEILKYQSESVYETEEDQQEAQEAYESFQDSYEEQLADLPEELTDEEKKKLKKAYRRASRLCHPDKLADEFKDVGTAIFKDLNTAYQHQDLKRVIEILETLKSGGKMNIASDSIDNKTILQQRINTLRNKISTLESEIQHLKDNETYQIIQDIEDRETYFSELQEEFEAQLEELVAENELA